MNRKLLLICYYFPPLGLGGVGRPLNLFKRLPSHGWDCDILTVKPVAYRSYEPELLANLDTSRIYRAGSLDPQRLLYLLGVRKIRAATIAKGRALKDRVFPDSKIGWVTRAIRLGRSLIENRKYDALVSSSPPISSHLVAERLVREYQLPWVADFRDYWTVFKIEESYSSTSLIRKGNQLKQRIAEHAVDITTVNRSIAAYLGRGTVIRNAFDEEIASLWKPPTENNDFAIGMVGHQDEFPSVQSLLKVIKCVEQSITASGAPIRIVQVGRADERLLHRELQQNGVRASMTTHGELKREEMVAVLSECSLLHFNVPWRAGHDIVPGKLYDLLASGRPLLVGASADGEVADILRQTKAGITYEEATLEQAAEYATDILAKHQRHALDIHPMPDYAREFGSDIQAAKFSELLNRLVR